MLNSQLVNQSADAAATLAQVRANDVAITAALRSTEAQLLLLAKLDPAARAVALRETSRACTEGSTEGERLALSAHQTEANDAFGTLRRIYVGLREDLLLLRQNSVALGAAAHALEQDGSD